MLSNVTTTTTTTPNASSSTSISDEHATSTTVSSISTTSSLLHDDEFLLVNGTAITNYSDQTEEDISITSTSSSEKVQFISTEGTSEQPTESSLSTKHFIPVSTPLPTKEEEEGVIKVDKDDGEPEIPAEISLKSSDSEGPEAIQHDYPVYSYDQDEVEIVKLNHDMLSTTMKSKTSYNHDKTHKQGAESESEKGNLNDTSGELTDRNLSADGSFKLHLNKPILKMHEGFDSSNNTTNSSETNKQQSKISIIEVPPIHTDSSNAKRILVNVTIATDPDASNPYASQSVYVLSVSVPTDNDPSHTPDVNVNSQMHHPVNPITTTEKPPPPWGGECQCSCPCLDDDKPNFTDIFSQDYDYEIADNKDPSLLQNISFTTLVDLAKRNASDATSTTESGWETSETTQSTTETQDNECQCPEITTQVPPTPMILVLEGRDKDVSKNPAINIAKALYWSVYVTFSYLTA